MKSKDTPTTVPLTIHLLEIWYLVKITHIDDSIIFDSIRNSIEHFVLPHAIWVPVATKAYHHKALIFGHDRLINMPSGDEVRQDYGAHF